MSSKTALALTLALIAACADTEHHQDPRCPIIVPRTGDPCSYAGPECYYALCDGVYYTRFASCPGGRWRVAVAACATPARDAGH